jgi:cytochrome bd-type quinol oxidase subunit 2
MTPFALSVGVFTTLFFAFEGASLIAAERGPSASGLPPHLRLARRAQMAAITSGAIVLGLARRGEWSRDFWSSPLSLGALALATVMVSVVGLGFSRGRPTWVRVALGIEATSILVGPFASRFPVLLRLRDDEFRFPDALALAESLPPIVVGLRWCCLLLRS